MECKTKRRETRTSYKDAFGFWNDFWTAEREISISVSVLQENVSEIEKKLKLKFCAHSRFVKLKSSTNLDSYIIRKKAYA